MIAVYLFVCMSVCVHKASRFVTIYSMISQKVVDGFRRNLVDRLGVSQRRIDSILVKIRIWIWIRELFNFQSDSSPLSNGAKNDVSNTISKIYPALA